MTTSRTLALLPLLGLAGLLPSQAKYFSYGPGCPGSTGGGTTPLLGNTGLPALGASSFRLDLLGARPNAPCVLLIGASDSKWQGHQLPLDLGPVNAKGCSLLSSLDLLFAARTNAAGAASFPFKVPGDPQLTGLTFFNQCAVDDPGANGFGVVLSNGGAGTLGLAKAQVPTVIADVVDGTCRDVAASTSRVWLAQGRRLAVFPTTGFQRIPAEERTYGSQLVAVEFNRADKHLYVASSKTVEAFDQGTGKRLTWSLPAGVAGINDLKFFAGIGRVIVLSGDTVRVLKLTPTSLTEIGKAPVPNTLIGGSRIQVHKLTSGTYAAYVVGMLAGSKVRDVNGFVTFDLNPKGTWQPVAQAVFNATTSHGSRATAQYLQIVSDARAGTDRAYLACGMQQVGNAWRALLLVLDVGKPAIVPTVVKALHLNHAWPAWNVQKDAAENTLWVACSNRLFRVDRTSLSAIGSTSIGFQDAGERDMAYVEQPGLGGEMWTATHHSVDYCLFRISVDKYTVPAYLPKVLARQWWISSSDGAVAVPEFKSVYLPTFGGLARYDISNPGKPVPAANSTKKAAYQPSGSNTEHVAYLRIDAKRGYVVTVRGDGGFEAYSVTDTDPNPAPPLSFKNPPSTSVYANGIETWSSGKSHYVLHDVTDRRTTPNTYYLQAWRYTGAGSFSFAAQVKISHPVIGAGLAHNVHTAGQHAFVGGEGCFFVVDLGNLPTSMRVTDAILIPKQDGVRGIAATQTHVFVGLDGNQFGGAIESYTFDPKTGDVGGAANTPLHRLTTADIAGLQIDSRVRYHARTQRIYACNKGGMLHEVDVSDPSRLVHLSTYDAPFRGESQDCRVYTLGGRPLVLYVKNNEAFALLDPDDGL